MKNQLRVLLVDDDEDEYIVLKNLVAFPPGGAKLQLELDWVATYDGAVLALNDCKYDVFLVDYHLGARVGLDLLGLRAAQVCPAPIIILTGQDVYDVDVAAMQAGAADYLLKGDLTLALLERSIRYGIERKKVEMDLAQLVEERTRAMALFQRRAHELDALQKATSSLLTTLDLNQLLGQILDAAQAAIPAAESSLLHLVDQPDSGLTEGAESERLDERIHVFKGPGPNQNSLLQSVYTGRALLIEDTRRTSGLQEILNEWPGRELRSLMIVPLGALRNTGPLRNTASLRISRAVIGLLALGASGIGAFSKADLGLVISFAATATAAIQNAMLHREIKNLATTDSLTGHHNRRALFDLGQREIERFHRFGHPLSAIMFDFDGFKLVNDHYGHSAGDQVLVKAIARCSTIIRQVDTLGRYGGDEFAVLLPEADFQTASIIAQRLKNCISDQPIETDAGPIQASVSVGVAQASRETTDFASLLALADQAMYQAKHSKKHRG